MSHLLSDTGYDLDALGQPVGRRLDHWQPPAAPARTVIEGAFCRLEPLDPGRHGRTLYHANQCDAEGRMWTYLPYGPFATFEAYQAWLEEMTVRPDSLFFAVVDRILERALGVAAFMRIDAHAGSMEVGHIAYAPPLQRTRAATEAMFLMMQRAFSAGFRRYEWKCNALNAASRRAAERLGFSYEGTFRQANVVKGRNRDTSCYSVIDREWPIVHEALRRWLAPENFDEQGRQRTPLATCREHVHVHGHQLYAGP